MELKHINFTSLRKAMSSFFNQIPDWRQQSKVSISIHDALMSGIACMFFQDPSLLQFQKRLQDEQHRNNLQTIFGVENIPKDTQMREITDQVDCEYFRPIFKDYFSRLQRSKQLTQYQLFPGLYLFSLDATGYFTSENIHCENCLINRCHREGFQIELQSNIPKEVTELKANTYYLVDNIQHVQSKYLLINKFEKVIWQLFYVGDDNQPIEIEISKVSDLQDLLNKKILGELSTDKNKKRIKKILTSYHDKTHSKAPVSYSHQALQGGIMHPDQSAVIPFMPEEICNKDGETKQDCEINAAKRLVEKVRQDHPQLGLIFNGDALYSRQPIIERILEKRGHYIFAAKPTDHKFLMKWLEAQPKLNEIEFLDEKGKRHHYEWIDNAPLNGREDSMFVNFFRCKIVSSDLKSSYQNSWVTDLPITEENIKTMVRAGRCRWKCENECFNVLKNHGYCLEHNYGHGEKNLSFNFYLMTLIGFFLHQISELTDRTYQALRKRCGSKRHLWEKLRSYIGIIIFDSWERLLSFTLAPPCYYATQAP